MKLLKQIDVIWISRKFIPHAMLFAKKVSCSADNVVSIAVSILKHRRSKSRWSNLRSLLAGKDPGLTSHQFSEIILQIRNNPHLAFSFLNFTLLHSLCSHTRLSHATVIHILSRSRLKLRAQNLIKDSMRLLSEADQHDSSSPIALFQALIKTYRACDSAPFVFDMLVKACIESKKIDDAVEIYQMLKSRNFVLRTNTCNSLIELVSKGKDCFAAFQLFRDMFGFSESVNGNVCTARGCVPNATTFNVLMVGFYREGLFEKVEEVWEEMEGQGCLPNAYGHNILMAMHCEDGKMGEAVKIWKIMENKGLKQDLMAYNTIIGGYCSICELQKAEEKCQEMIKSGLEYTGKTFNHLISGYCRIGNADSAILLYDDMCSKGFSGENSIINVLIGTLCDSNKVLPAIKIFRFEIKKYDVVLEEGTYVKLIKAMCEEGMMEDALSAQAYMVGKGFKPNSDLYSAFIDGYMKQGNETMVYKLRNEMLCL